jgi:long-chain acyl-CoA synthetase
VGAIDVPAYPNISSEDYAFIFNDASVKHVFLSDADLFAKVSEVKDRVSSLENIYGFVDIDGCSNWDVVFAMADEKHRDELNRRMAAVDEMDLAT